MDNEKNTKPAEKAESVHVINGRKGAVHGKKGGRPKIKIDWGMVTKMFEFGCTIKEVCSVTGYELRTYERHCLLDLKTDFHKLYEKHHATFRTRIRLAQYQRAVEDRNTTMLIFLGKAILGQRDTQYIEQSGSTQVHVTHDKYDDMDLVELTKRQEEIEKQMAN